MNTIKKESWHYRLHKLMKTDTFIDLKFGQQLSLCTYCQSLFFHSLLWLFISFFLGVGIFNFISPVLVLLGFNVPDAFIIFGLVQYGMVSIGLVIWLIHKWYLEYKCKNPEPSLILEWFKAKKNKVCPMLILEKEVVDGKV